MENMYFAHSGFFFLLILVGVCYVYAFTLKRQKSFQISSFEDIQKVFGKGTKYLYIYYAVLLLISLFCIILLAKPVEKYSRQMVEKNGIDMALVFDVSNSMQAQDISPNRLEVAKQVIDKFLEKIVADRIGFVFFAGKPFISTPLTYDTIFLRKYLKGVDTNIVNQKDARLQGTAIGDAMVLGEKLLQDEKNTGRKKVMILITDGEANTGIDPKLALKLLKQSGIKTYTIGVGGLEKTYITAQDIFGRIQKVEVGGLDEKTLENIATITGGKYYRATSKDTLEKIFDDIGKIEKNKIVTNTKEIQKERFSFFLKIVITLQCFLFTLILFRNIRL